MAFTFESLWSNQGPDSGWSWIVAVACSLTTFGTYGIFRTAGVFYVEVIHVMGTTRQVASWPFSVCGTVNSISGFLAAILTHIFAIRTVVLFGCFLSSLGLFLSYLADTPEWLTVTYGVVHGSGIGIVITCMPIVLSMYFKSHKTTANGIFLAGGSLAGLILPPLTEIFIEYYSLRGAFVLMAAMSIQAIVFAALIRPISKQKPVVNNNRHEAHKMLQETSEPALTNSSKIIDFFSDCKSVSANPMLALVTISNVATLFTVLTFGMIMVDYGLDKGMEMHQAILLTSIVAIPEFFGRLCFGWVSDKGYIARKTMLFGAQVLSGCLLLLMTMTNNIVLLFIVCGLFGFTTGNAFVLVNVLLIDYVKQSHLRIAFGITRAWTAVAFLLRPPITGLFRDVIGSYDYLLWTLAVLNVMSGSLWKFETCLARRIKREIATETV